MGDENNMGFYKVPEQVLKTLLEYLSRRPYEEVWRYINIIQNNSVRLKKLETDQNFGEAWVEDLEID